MAIVADASEASPRVSASLDGQWQIVFDRQNVGVERCWSDPTVFAALESRSIPVPSCWEEHEEDYEGVAWYSREFVVPAGWRGKHVRLQFDAVNYLAEVWINGRVAGSEESGFTPVEFDVTQLVDYGRSNRLVVRVVGAAVRSQRSGQFVTNEVPAWRGAYLGGIWQSVRLIATDPIFVRDVFVEPKIGESSAVVHIELANETFQPVPEVGSVPAVGKDHGPAPIPATIKSRQVRAEVSLSARSEPLRALAAKTITLTVPPGTTETTANLKIANPVLWSPDNPHLYVATVRLVADGRQIDSLSVRFGMRELTIRENDFYLNGEKLFIKGAFWEGLYPVTLGHPRDPQIVRREIRMAKEAGFNLLRPWRMPPAPMILDIADEMGILLIGSPAVACMAYWPAETPRMEHYWTRALTETIRRDRNHPSIVMWETTNEIVRRSMLVRRHHVTLAGRKVDPTRLIIDESGGARSVWGSFAYLPYSSEPLQIDDRHIYRRAPVDESTYQDLNQYGSDGQIVFVSEVGYGSFPDIAASVARYRKEGNPKTPDYKYHVELLNTLEAVMAEQHLNDIFPDVKALCDSSQEIQALGNKLQLEALRLNPKADGYCIHAYTGGDWVLGAGVLDMWRNPKKLYDCLRELQKPLYLAIRVTPSNVYASRGTRLAVTSANDGLPVNGELELFLEDGRRRQTRLRQEKTSIPGGITRLVEQPIDTSRSTGTHAVVARFQAGGRIVAENRCELLVIADEEVKPAPGKWAVVDVQGKLRRFLKPRGVHCVNFDEAADVSGPVLVAPRDAWSESEIARFVRLMGWVERGGVAVWLDSPSKFVQTGQPAYLDPKTNFMMRFRNPKRQPEGVWPNYLIDTGVFPFPLQYRGARGMWIPVGHYARKHPVFEGLPTTGFMSWPWQNVIPSRTIINLDVPSIAGCVSWDSYQDYRAKTRAWHGVDLAVLPHGKGELIVSTFQFLPHLGSDPLADKLFLNLRAFAVEEQGAIDPPARDLHREIEEKTSRFRRVKAEWESKLKAAEAEPWP